MKLLKLEIKKGQEVMRVLKREFAKKKLESGAIVSVIGAVDECCISTMQKKDAMKDLLKVYKEPLEMSGTGEIKDGKPHLHAVFGREDKSTISGHLHWAKVISWFVNVYVLI